MPGRLAPARFIPGYAGNAWIDLILSGKKTVYPRLRGERLGHCLASCSACGLSPATRGTRYGQNLQLNIYRFIPGYAGNAPDSHPGRMLVTVYPRLRGERRWPPRLKRPNSGLSPATRGTQWRASRCSQKSRFIPGYAGNANTGW